MAGDIVSGLAPTTAPRIWSRAIVQCSGERRLLRPSVWLSPTPSIFGVTDIPRKPNYDFERREREKTKAGESAKKAQAKVDKKAALQATPDADGSSGS